MSSKRTLVSVLLALLVLGAFSSTLNASTATLTTDKPRYSLGEPMVISGTNFSAGAPVTVTINKPDQTTDALAGTTNTTGAFSVTFTNASVPGRYKITATDGINTANVAVTQADALNSDFKQCSNDNNVLGTCNWINSILQQNNSVNFEGMSTLQRLIFDGIVPPASGNTHTLSFHHDAVKSGHHAYDFVTSWEAATTAAAQIDTTHTLFPDLSHTSTGDANACGSAIPNSLAQTCLTLRGNFTSHPTFVATVNIPTMTDPAIGGNVAGKVSAYETHYSNTIAMRLYGNAAITNATLTFNGYDAISDQHAYYTLTWTSTSTQLLVEFAGHIAVSQDNIGTGYGAGLGASFINGGPYHISLDLLDNGSIGNQDNQLKGSDILIPAAPPNVTTDLRNASNQSIPVMTSVPVGTVVHDTVSVDSGSTLNLIPSSSSVTFHRYSTFDCSGSSVDQVVSVTSGSQTATASSTSFTPTTGSYSYKADFTSGNTSIVLNGISTCEPFRVVDARITVSPLTATNEVNHQHTITATVSQDDGIPAGVPGDNATGFGPAPDGTLVTFTLVNNAAGAAFVGVNTCTTTGGTCSVIINSSTAGGVDIHATTTFSVGSQSLTRATGDGLSGDSANAHKDYVDAQISISPLTATNAVGSAHTFTATVKQNTGSGFVNAIDGTLVTFTLPNNTIGATFVNNVNTCTTLAGVCSVSVNSTTAGTATIQASAAITVSGIQVTRTTGDNLSGDSANASKTWVDAYIAITPPSATNPIGQAHTITATVKQNTGSGWVAAPNGTTVTFSLLNNTAGATFVAGNTCMTTAGICTVQINSGTPGSVTIHATTTFSVLTVSLTRSTGDSVSLDSANATKTYVAAVLRIAKKTVPSGDTTVFTFTPTGWNVGATFPLSDGQTFSSGNLAPSTYSGAEAVPNTFVLTSVGCVLTGTQTPHNFTAITNGVSVLLAASEDVTCTFTNSRLPTLIVKKTIMGNSATFNFNISGNPTNPPDQTPSLTPNANSSAQTASQIIQLGTYVIDEVNLPPNWLLTDTVCTSNPASNVFSFTPSATGGTFTAGYGDNILCSFVDNEQGSATRTQGFWATHTVLTNDIWNGTPLPPGTSTIPASPVIGTADAKLCTANDIMAISTYPPNPGANEVLGGFWAGISKTSTNKKRSDLDQTRMQFLQQYLAAVLNVHAFGTPIPGTTLATARAAYCGNNADLIKHQQSLLASYNSMGDNVTFTPGVSATTQESKKEADIRFWDNTFE